MEAIRNAIEWIASDSGVFAALAFPFLLIGLSALWLLWMLIGWLRVSQVGLAEERATGAAPRLGGGGEPAAEIPRGVPYCAVDRIVYEPGARFCAVCERDLVLDCRSCGATIGAADPSCYRCGTPTGAAETPLLG